MIIFSIAKGARDHLLIVLGKVILSSGFDASGIILEKRGKYFLLNTDSVQGKWGTRYKFFFSWVNAIFGPEKIEAVGLGEFEDVHTVNGDFRLERAVMRTSRTRWKKPIDNPDTFWILHNYPEDLKDFVSEVMNSIRAETPIEATVKIYGLRDMMSDLGTGFREEMIAREGIDA